MPAGRQRKRRRDDGTSASASAEPPVAVRRCDHEACVTTRARCRRAGKWRILDGQDKLYCWQHYWTAVSRSTCCICLDEVKNSRSAYALGCGHAMHRSCIDRWLHNAHDQTCPVCRQRMSQADVSAVVYGERMRGWCDRYARLHPIQQRVVWDTMDAVVRECEDGVIMAVMGLPGLQGLL